MPKVKVGALTMGYELTGTGDPLVLIPYLGADRACYAFQVPAYAERFTCIALDLRDTGESDTVAGSYTTADLADDVAGFMEALGIARAHVAGMSLGAAVGMWLAARHPRRVRSLSLHSPWTRTDAFVRTVVASWQPLARQLGNVAETIVNGIFPWCFTPELYVERPEHLAALAAFVRGRPAQPVGAFVRQSGAVLTHDVGDELGKITCPTLATFGRDDRVTSLRFAEPLRRGIRGAELTVFEGCAHAPLYERVDDFNARTLSFLERV